MMTAAVNWIADAPDAEQNRAHIVTSSCQSSSERRRFGAQSPPTWALRCWQYPMVYASWAARLLPRWASDHSSKGASSETPATDDRDRDRTTTQ